LNYAIFFIKSTNLSFLDFYNSLKSNFLPHLEIAIAQARRLDVNLEERWIEDRLGTRVYQLVSQLIL
jgi:hypothetical protein